MRNFDSAYFFKQKFSIISSATKSENTVTSLPQATIQFLPESGNLIINKQNVIAFKAVNQSGLPEYIKGVIKNKEGDSITSFSSIHDGMGKFLLMPLSNETYTAEWKDLLGITHQKALPNIKEEGINLILESGSVKRIFHIQRTNKVPETMKHLLLVGQMNGAILFKANIDLSEKESISSSLPISKITSGILHLTIFDANKQPLCERLIFVKNDDYLLQTTVKVDTLNTRKRAKNTIEIELKDSSYANFSLAITDADLNAAPENTIASQLLLQGDLKGNIYQPAYYFSSNADSVANHLDLVMLTNGWSRFNWKKILNNPLPSLPFTKDSAYQTLIGKVPNLTLKKNNIPASINLIFSAKDSSENMLTVPIQADGSFTAKNVILYDTTKIFYTIDGINHSSKNKVQIENDFFKINPQIELRTDSITTDTIGLSKFQYLIEEQKKLDLLKQKTTLQEVTVHAIEKTRLKQLDLKYAKGIFSAQANAAFDMSTLENASHTQSVFDFLTGRVPGLVIGGTLGGTATEGVAEFRRGTPSFYLDDVFIPTSELPNIDLSIIAYIKVFNPPFVGGMSGTVGGASINVVPSGGAIVMYRKIGGDIAPEKNNYNTSGMDFQILAGYAPVKEFYSPGYAEKEQTYTMKDLRTTLLWNPWINLDKLNKKTKISFYNNDVTHSFRLILEGMDSKGKLIHISQILK